VSVWFGLIALAFGMAVVIGLWLLISIFGRQHGGDE
jgi:hypothetical protein